MRARSSASPSTMPRLTSMPSATVADKAARALLEGRITILSLTTDALTIECKSAHLGCSYLATFGRDSVGTLRSCTCPNGRVHSVHPRCWHATAAELLAPTREGSSR